MPKATHTRSTGCVVAPSRRQLGGSILAAACGAAFAGAIVMPDWGEALSAAATPDAELICLCAECDALQAQIDALYLPRLDHLPHPQILAAEDARTRAIEPIADRQDPLLDRICAMRATTPQGQIARARTLLAWDKDPIWTHDGCWNSQLIGAIVRDLVGAA